jgi:hypothetical protein
MLCVMAAATWRGRPQPVANCNQKCNRSEITSSRSRFATVNLRRCGYSAVGSRRCRIVTGAALAARAAAPQAPRDLPLFWSRQTLGQGMRECTGRRDGLVAGRRCPWPLASGLASDRLAVALLRRCTVTTS